jgi:hypothetical protein
MQTGRFLVNAHLPEPSSRKKFMPCEDARLVQLVMPSRTPDWEAIARNMPGRNARQCRERWKHYVSVGCIDRPWTQSEDDLLIEKECSIGPRWTQISTFFYNRSDIQVKSRWIKLTQRRESQRSAKPAPIPVVIERKPPVMLFDENNLFPQSDLDLKITFSPGVEGDFPDLAWF